MVAVTAALVVPAPASTVPVICTGLDCPAPTISNDIDDPAGAGFTGLFTDMSGRFLAQTAPVPLESWVRIAGVVAATGSVSGPISCPFCEIVIDVVCAATSNGTTALI